MSYQKQISELCAAGALDTRPSVVSHVTVSPDADCPKLRGGACLCKPDVRAGAPQPNRAQKRAQKQGKS